MAFTQLVKNVGHFEREKTIIVLSTLIRFSTDIYEDLNTKYVTIFIDYDANKLGFKKSETQKNAFSFQKYHSLTKAVFLSKNRKMKMGEYSATKEGDMWIIENFFDTPIRKETGLSKKGKIKEGEISVVKSGIFFPPSFDMQGKDRVERVIKERTEDYDLILFKPTLNTIDGRMVTPSHSGAKYLLFTNTDYRIGRYNYENTKEGIIVKILKIKNDKE